MTKTPKKYLDKHKEYYASHIDKIRDWQKDYYQKNKEIIRLRQQEYEEKNRVKFKIYQKKYREKLRLEVLTHYGGNPPKCACKGCNETRIEFLTIDHINGGGHKHELLRKRGSIYTWLKTHNYPEGYRVLCYNCNCSLGHNDYCPHQKEVFA